MDPAEPNRLVLRSSGLLLRLRARVAPATLDRELASGTPPESRAVLAARANYLVSLSARRAIVRGWRNLVRKATQPPKIGNLLGVPICRGRVCEAEIPIEAMIAVLSKSAPHSARGVALASWLLTDGTGPVYNRALNVDLVSVVRQATSLLDPSVPLTRAW
jgi:hypothetical protein